MPINLNSAKVVKVIKSACALLGSVPKVELNPGVNCNVNWVASGNGSAGSTIQRRPSLLDAAAVSSSVLRSAWILTAKCCVESFLGVKNKCCCKDVALTG